MKNLLLFSCLVLLAGLPACSGSKQVSSYSACTHDCTSCNHDKQDTCSSCINTGSLQYPDTSKSTSYMDFDDEDDMSEDDEFDESNDSDDDEFLK
jgi:hypothetical protein